MEAEEIGIIHYFFAEDLTFGDLRKGIDGICVKPENVNIPVLHAARAFVSQAHGTKPQDIEEYLRGMRISNGK